MVHGVLSAAPSGCIGELGTCGPWALGSPLGMIRFEGGGVAENCLYMMGNVRNKGMKRCCHDLSGVGIDLRRE